MAQYPIKMLKDEYGNPFVPLVSPEAVRDVLDRDWESMIKDKMDQLDPMPQANEDLLGKIVQYKGTTNANYQQGFFYKCVSNGATPPVYSWALVNVQNLDNYLSKNNTVVYTPTGTYHPATKGYVDDGLATKQNEIDSTHKLSADLVDDSSSTNKFVTANEKTAWNAKGSYSKPSGGIPKTDLASSVQTSLGLADTALQQSDLDNYLSKTNTTSYSPTGDYHPATKKYVDDRINNYTPPVYDGTGVFGWYSSAQSGEDLTTNYDVSVDDMDNLQAGSLWGWPSRVYSGGQNSCSVSYVTEYIGWDETHTTQYNAKLVSMNGNYYEYAYDDTNVYKEVYPGGGVACLSADTKVWTENGAKEIKDIKLGDKVLAYNWCLDNSDYYAVDHINSHEETVMYEITFKNKNKLLLTGDHPVWEKEKGRVPARALTAGQILMNEKGEEFVIEGVKEKTETGIVYDLHMGKGILNYYVGDDKIMVFNEPVDAGK